MAAINVHFMRRFLHEATGPGPPSATDRAGTLRDPMRRHVQRCNATQSQAVLRHRFVASVSAEIRVSLIATGNAG